MKKMWNWLKSLLPSIRRQKTARALVARVMPSDDEVRYARRVHRAKYDSKMEDLDHPSELAQKITKKRAELGRLDYLEQQIHINKTLLDVRVIGTDIGRTCGCERTGPHTHKCISAWNPQPPKCESCGEFLKREPLEQCQEAALHNPDK